MRLRAVWINAHVFAFRRAQRRGVKRNVRQAAHIHAVMVRRGAFIVKHIYPAELAEIMFGDFHIPLIQAQRLLARRYR